MIAQFDGSCHECGGPISKGERIVWTERGGSVHTRCFKGESSDPDDSNWEPWMLTDEDPVVRIAKGLPPKGKDESTSGELFPAQRKAEGESDE